MDRILLIIIVAALIFVVTGIVAARDEAKRFNNGTCVRCGHKLRHFDDDSQGGSGYVCDNCDYTCWVSYHSVDRHYHDRR